MSETETIECSNCCSDLNNKKMLLQKNRFVINLFGESGSGKTQILSSLTNILCERSKYVFAVSDGFLSRDRRTMTWYRTGKKFSGAVCVCTSGDSIEIIQQNFRFFCNHLGGNSPWLAWQNEMKQIKSVQEFERFKLDDVFRHGEPIAILVTASRKPLELYGKLQLAQYTVVNIPVRADVWHGNRTGCAGNVPWMASVRTTPEALLFHVNYILRHGQIKGYINAAGHRVCVKAMRANVSRD